MTPTLELLPGLRLIFESEDYSIKDETVSGHIVLVDTHHWGDVGLSYAGTRRKFYLVNNLCTIEDMAIFNRHKVVQLVARGSERLFEGKTCVHVHFNYERTGIRT